ncbi:MAG: hypothetical protein HUU48_04135 [Flavobacteriales bacterium]|nr:hypothetical protein [Flavobacteriales bacterium]
MEDKIYTQSKSELENKLITAYNNVIDTLILFAIEYKDNPKELSKNIEIAENDYWSYFHSNNINFLLENNCLNKQQAVEILALREKIAQLSSDRWDDFSIKFSDEWIQLRKQANQILISLKVRKRKLDKQFEIPPKK